MRGFLYVVAAILVSLWSSDAAPSQLSEERHDLVKRKAEAGLCPVGTASICGSNRKRREAEPTAVEASELDLPPSIVTDSLKGRKRRDAEASELESPPVITAGSLKGRKRREAKAPEQGRSISAAALATLKGRKKREAQVGIPPCNNTSALCG